MGRNHRVVQGAMPAGGAAGCHHYRGHRAQGGCTAHGAAYGQRAAFFASILIEEEATIPTVNPRRTHGVQVAVDEKQYRRLKAPDALGGHSTAEHQPLAQLETKE